jgi:NCS2 family nucleobase:cation symporter-2
MGVTFVGVMPSIAIASQPGLGLAGVYGAAIAAGIIVLPLVPFAGRLRSILTPSVTGTAMVLIGLSLMGVAIDWAAGGRGAPDYGSARNLFLSGLTIGTILVVTRYGGRFMANCAILIGMVCGYLAAIPLGAVTASDIGAAASFRMVTPFHFGLPTFDPAAIASMVVVLLVTLVESSGMLTMLGDMVEEPLDARGLARGLRADCVGAIVGGIFNSFPYTSYAQNIALVSLTGVRSRFVCAGAAVLMLGLALLPKISAVVAAMPPSVLGGAALVLFGMVAATGIRSLASAGLDGSRENLLVVAVALGVGLVPTLSERFLLRRLRRSLLSPTAASSSGSSRLWHSISSCGQGPCWPSQESHDNSAQRNAGSFDCRRQEACMKFDGSVVPIIDLTPALTGDEAAKQAVAEKVGAAARSIGFLVVSGHGVPAEIIERASEASRKVFDMSPPKGALSLDRQRNLSRLFRN